MGLVFEAGVARGSGVAHGGPDGDAGQVADAADVAAGGVDLLEDGIFSQRWRSQGGAAPGELFADRGEPGAAVLVL
ncbi:MAG TPA: hypothetical protein VLX59_01315 [Acidimicrobiales bacterium]|nr:hypothetical protein [Acidimicrobiales bacterium]